MTKRPNSNNSLILVLMLLLPVMATARTDAGKSTAVESIEGAANIQSINDESHEAEDELNIKEFILDHLADAYEWQIVSDGKRHITISLPVILRSKSSGWHLFSSARLRDVEGYREFQIAKDGKYKGKIVERAEDGNLSRPLDLSLTKNAAALLIASLILILIMGGVARSFKREPMEGKKGFVGMMEMLIASINDDIIKPSLGADHKRY